MEHAVTVLQAARHDSLSETDRLTRELAYHQSVQSASVPFLEHSLGLLAKKVKGLDKALTLLENGSH